MLPEFQPGFLGATASIQTIADLGASGDFADRKLTFSEFPSNPADVIRSPTLESVRTNLPGMRLSLKVTK